VKRVAPISELTGYRRRRESQIVERFNRLYYNSPTWTKTYWLGVRTQKAPSDLWIYQEILHETRPDVIVETGTADGGSALYLASMCDLVGHGRVITIDIEPENPTLPKHERIRYVRGRSSVDPGLDLELGPSSRVMVILDSDHTEAHVRAELERFAPLVSPGCYLIIEDTNINGHPVLPTFGPGPMEAAQEFLATHPEFEVDRGRERHLVTMHPRGYLRRVS
jgi:cephalosporin hydroxylase